MKLLVTGAAGFVGFHFIQRCLAEGHSVVGIDNLNDYYDPQLKHDRLAQLGDAIEFHTVNLADAQALEAVFAAHTFDAVINLAAQAGVRYSIENPKAYIDANLVGFANLLECCRHAEIAHLIYASSSSVYGANEKMPFSVEDNVDHPVSLYAATKKSNELLAHSYAHLYGLPCTGLRFFTVYGPWGRPDMAYFSFTKAILAGEPIKVFNHGKMKRDFTYIDDIVQGMMGVLAHPPAANPNWDRVKASPADSSAPYRVFNIGNNTPVALGDFIATLENCLGKTAEKIYMPMQDGDVPATYADVSALTDLCGYQPSTDIQTGLSQFVEWYRRYYRN